MAASAGLKVFRPFDFGSIENVLGEAKRYGNPYNQENLTVPFVLVGSIEMHDILPVQRTFEIYLIGRSMYVRLGKDLDFDLALVFFRHDWNMSVDESNVALMEELRKVYERVQKNARERFIYNLYVVLLMWIMYTGYGQRYWGLHSVNLGEIETAYPHDSTLRSMREHLFAFLDRRGHREIIWKYHLRWINRSDCSNWDRHELFTGMTNLVRHMAPHLLRCLRKRYGSAIHDRGDDATTLWNGSTHLTAASAGITFFGKRIRGIEATNELWRGTDTNNEMDLDESGSIRDLPRK